MIPRTHALILIKTLLVAGLFWAGAGTAVEVPFGIEQSIDPSFDGARSIAAADFDGDGDLDILAAARFADDVAWWENTVGDGSAWTEHTIETFFDGALSVAAADIDGDGDLDVLGAAQDAQAIAWWENTTSNGSTWTRHTVDSFFHGALSVAAADIDGDGDLDVLGGGGQPNGVLWWENTAGDGSAWTEHTIHPLFGLFFSVAAADVDGDGDLDALGAATVFTENVSWWENLVGDGSSWTEHTIDADYSSGACVSAADVDGDGDLDVLGGGGHPNSVSWWENTVGDGSAWTEHLIDAFFTSVRSVVAADVDGDGDLDTLGAASSANDIAWWENTAGDGSSWTKHTIDTFFVGATSVAAADLDSDGDLDVLGASEAADDIAWWENATIHASAVHPFKHTIDADFDGARAVHTADLDSDGDLDALGAAVTADEITWWENTAGDGSVWTEHTIEPNFDGASAVVAADVDGDGDLDALGAAVTVGDIAWWENTAGDGSAWTKHSIDNDFDGASAVAAADIDGDGDLDALGAAVTAGDIAWWENTAGDGSAWTKHSIDNDFDGAPALTAADLDGDGDLDVLGAAGDLDDISWWENTACDGSAWTEHSIDSDFGGASAVAAADLDGDGDLDVLGAAGDLDDISWWENTAGDGSAWTEHSIDSDFGGASAVAAADLDGDGDLDVLGAAGDLDDISWWENRGGQFALPTTDLAPARLADGALTAALEIDAFHRGRAGDSGAELVALELLLTDAAATPLTDTEADDLLSALSVYLDDGDGTFDAGLDTEVTFVASFPLTAGVLTFPFADSDPNVRIAQGTPRKYFVTAELEADASLQTPDDLQITHVTEASSTGEDAENDLPITLEYSVNTVSTAIEVNDLPVAQPDAFSAVENRDLTGNVLSDNGAGADSDEESDPLTTTLVDAPILGTLLGGMASDGSFTYQPNPDTPGIDTFTYRASDGQGDSNLATATITILPAEIFADGFESGNTSAWTLTVP